jgi:flagellar basal body-associated protein FliL
MSAADKNVPSAATAQPAAAPAAKPARSKTKLLIALAVLAVTLVECAAAYLYLPGGDSTGSELLEEPTLPPAKETGHAKSKPAKAADKGPADHGHADAGKSDHEKYALGRLPKAADDHHEIDLGNYRVTAYQPLSNTTLRLDFHLYATVKEDDETACIGLLEAKKQRFRDLVIVTVRSADMTDFTDAGLGLLKRRILETTNKMLGKPFLQSVIFSEFSFVEQ